MALFQQESPASLESRKALLPFGSHDSTPPQYRETLRAIIDGDDSFICAPAPKYPFS
jgi:hypothetical protein